MLIKMGKWKIQEVGMNKQLEETKQQLQELEKQAKEIAAFLASYENSIYVNLVKQHTVKVVKEIEIALSFLSLIED
jgi:hypothetical protein